MFHIFFQTQEGKELASFIFRFTGILHSLITLIYLIVEAIYLTEQRCCTDNSLVMPALSFKFDNTDPLTGEDVDDSAQFISSVYRHGESSTLVAMNSMGNSKLLEIIEAGNHSWSFYMLQTKRSYG